MSIDKVKPKRKDKILRMDQDLYDKLKKLADLDDRDVNTYIVRLIKKDVAEKEGKL